MPGGFIGHGAEVPGGTNEFTREKFIEYSIAATRYAYGLEDIKPVRSVIASEGEADAGQADKSIIEKNSATLNNLRLWDFHYQQVYNQLQQLRYYNLQMWMDRYQLEMNTPGMLSVRELNQDNTGAGQNLGQPSSQYTHGYGR